MNLLPSHSGLSAAGDPHLRNLFWVEKEFFIALAFLDCLFRLTQIKKRGTYFLLEPRVTTPTLSNKLFHAVATAFGNLFLKVLPRLLEDFVVNEVQE